MHLILVSDFLSSLLMNDMATVKNRVGVCSRQILLNCAVARPVESSTLFWCGPDELQRPQLYQKTKQTFWIKCSILFEKKSNSHFKIHRLGPANIIESEADCH